MEDAQPGTILLHPNIGKIAFPRSHFAISLQDSERMVGNDRDVSIVIDAEAMAVLLHGVHFEYARLQPRCNFGFGGAASIDVCLCYILGVILADPIDRLRTAFQ